MSLFFQLCPDQPCGSAMTIGNGINLPTTAAPDGDPCTAFSVGAQADEANAQAAIACKGDLIRIPGKYSSSRWILCQLIMQEYTNNQYSIIL